jgi:hypothetical protein
MYYRTQQRTKEDGLSHKFLLGDCFMFRVEYSTHYSIVIVVVSQKNKTNCVTFFTCGTSVHYGTSSRYYSVLYVNENTTRLF